MCVHRVLPSSDCPSTQCTMLGKRKIKTEELFFSHTFSSRLSTRTAAPSCLPNPNLCILCQDACLNPTTKCSGCESTAAQLCTALKPSIWFSKVNPDHFMMTHWWGFGKREKNQLAPRFSLHILCSLCLLAPPFPTTTLASFAKTLAWTPTTECWSSFSCPFIIQNRFPSFYFVSCPPVAINDTDSSLRAEPH